MTNVPPAAARPKVLFLVSEDRFFWSHRLPVARAARQHGYEVVVATRVESYEQQIRDEGFRLIPLKLARKTSSPLYEIRTLRQLLRIYKAEKPDFAHHFALKPVLYGSIAALRRKDTRMVNVLTGLGFLVASKSWKARFMRPMVWRAFRFLLNRPNQSVVVENDQDRQLLIAKVNVPPEKITLIRGSGVNIDAYQPTPEPSGVPVVLLASRMLWIKGVGEFVEAATMLRARGAQARFVLAGDTDPSNPSCVPREQLLAWENSGVVEWWGHQEKMRPVFEQAAIVCLPSHGGEGTPQVLMEAAASGRALVTTDVPGCRDVVQHEVNGIVVPPRAPEALAAAIQKLLVDPVLRRRMARQSRELATREFAEEAVVRQTLVLYDEAGRGAAP